MSFIQSYVLDVEHARERFAKAWRLAETFLQHGKSVRVILEEFLPIRTHEQNAKLWACLGDIAEQVDWPVNGVMSKLTPEDWKDILTAGLKKNQRVAAGVEGGFVLLGERTSRMKVGEMVELIEFVLWFGSEHDVIWTEPKKGKAK